MYLKSEKRKMTIHLLQDTQWLGSIPIAGPTWSVLCTPAHYTLKCLQRAPTTCTTRHFFLHFAESYLELFQKQVVWQCVTALQINRWEHLHTEYGVNLKCMIHRLTEKAHDDSYPKHAEHSLFQYHCNAVYITDHFVMHISHEYHRHMTYHST